MCCKGKIEPEKKALTERAGIFHGLRVHLKTAKWHRRVVSNKSRRLGIESERFNNVPNQNWSSYAPESCVISLVISDEY